jgi:HK97 gp10 family phage protein
MRGDADAMLAIGLHFTNIMKELVNQPGTGRTYDTEIRVIKGKPRVLRTKEHPEGVPRVPHVASAPGSPPAPDLATLRNAIVTEITSDTKRVTKVGVGISNVAYYWEYLEDGTRWMEPRPFVRPAYEIGKSGAGDKFIKHMRKRTKQRLARRKARRG